MLRQGEIADGEQVPVWCILTDSPPQQSSDLRGVARPPVSAKLADQKWGPVLLHKYLPQVVLQGKMQGLLVEGRWACKTLSISSSAVVFMCMSEND